jgi:hypothetical protein
MADAPVPICSDQIFPEYSSNHLVTALQIRKIPSERESAGIGELQHGVS